MLICISLLMGCSKKTITTTYTDNTPASIAMGQSSGDVTNTQKVVDITQGAYQPVGTLTLDVNADGQADFNLSVQNQYNMASQHLYSSQIDVASLNDDSFILTQSAYSVFSYTLTYDIPTNSMDTTAVVRNTITKLNPKVLLQGNSVSKSDNWLHGGFNLSTYTDNRYTYTSTTEYDGNWAHADGWYIGIKFQNRLGWIRITSNGYSIHVHEFALVKSSL